MPCYNSSFIFRHLPYLALVLVGAVGILSYAYQDDLVRQAVVVAILLGVVSFLFPMMGFYAFILIKWIESVFFMHESSGVYEGRYYIWFIIVIFSFLGLLARQMLTRFRTWQHTPLDGLFLIILFLETASVLWSPPTAYSFSFYLTISLVSNLCAFYLHIHLITDRQKLERLFVVLIFCSLMGTVSILLNIYYDSLDYSIVFDDSMSMHIKFVSLDGRPGGLSGPSHLSGFIVTIMMVTLYYVYINKNIMVRFLLLSLLFANSVAVVAGQTRSVFLECFMGLLFYIYFSPYAVRRKVAIVTFGFVFLITSMAVYSPSFINRIMIGFGYTGEFLFEEKNVTKFDTVSGNYGTEPEGESGMAVRVWWWKNGLKEMNKEPLTYLFGLGAGGFEYYSKGSPEANAIVAGFFYDLGLMGCILFTFFVVILLSHLRYWVIHGKKLPSYHHYLLVLTGLFMEVGLHGLVDYDINSYGSRNFWVPLALTMATINIMKKEVISHDQASFDHATAAVGGYPQRDGHGGNPGRRGNG